MSDYGISTTLDTPFPDVVAAVRTALAEQGFGVLTEIDVTATMKAKLGVDVAPYLILGACNPALAHQALGVDPSLGLLLPCNVIVRQTEDGTVVEAIDPMMMVSLSANAALQPVADDAGTRLRAAVAALHP